MTTSISRAAVVLVLLGWVGLSLGGGCSPKLSLDGRACPCVETGWYCCGRQNVCVRTLHLCPPDGDDQCPKPGTTGTGGTSAVQADGSGTSGAMIATSCAAATGSSEAGVLPYTPGYTPDPAVVALADKLLSSMSPSDRANQMRGRGLAQPLPYNDIQRTEDTPKDRPTVRGFQFRDGTRGVNLGEDIYGVYPNATNGPNRDGYQVGYSTAFPVAIARAASFDVDLEHAIGEAIGDEAQAVNQTVLMAPFLNLLRNPLWGRAQETYGEDPFLAGRLGTAMTVGIQEHVLAMAKHFIAYDVEQTREKNVATVDEQALREIYGRPFRMVIRDGGVGAVMAAMNAVNGPFPDGKASLNAHLLTDVLRNDFGFKGFVVSDWWGLPNDAPETDAYTLGTTATQAIKAGLDVEMPWAIAFAQIEGLLEMSGVPGRLTTDDVNRAARRILEQKVRFNAYEQAGGSGGAWPFGLGAPSTRYRDGVISCDAAHAALAVQAAREGMVLLKNENGVLPLRNVQKVAILGASVSYQTDDLGYTNMGKVRTIDFAKDVVTGNSGSSRVYHNPGNGYGPAEGLRTMVQNVVVGKSAADVGDADFVVVVAGLTPEDEGDKYTHAGDRASLALDAKQPARLTQVQNDLIRAVAALRKPFVVVLEGGSVIDMPWFDEVPAVVMAWYPGQAGGQALAELLLGMSPSAGPVNFSGKLPISWSDKLADYPSLVAGSIDPSNEANGAKVVLDDSIGYRGFDRRGLKPLFPFGHGLSYTTFAYRNLQLGCSELGQGAVLPVVVNVANTGEVAGDETVFVFVSYPESQARPVKELKGFQRVHLEKGEEKQVTIPVRLSDLDTFRPDGPGATTGKWLVESGPVTIQVGGSAANLPLGATVLVNGYDVPAP